MCERTAVVALPSPPQVQPGDSNVAVYHILFTLLLTEKFVQSYIGGQRVSDPCISRHLLTFP